MVAMVLCAAWGPELCMMLCAASCNGYVLLREVPGTALQKNAEAITKWLKAKLDKDEVSGASFLSLPLVPSSCFPLSLHELAYLVQLFVNALVFHLHVSCVQPLTLCNGVIL